MTSNIHPAFRQDILFAVKALIICSVKSIFPQCSQIAHRRYLSPVDIPCTTCPPLAAEIARRGGQAVTWEGQAPSSHHEPACHSGSKTRCFKARQLQFSLTISKDTRRRPGPCTHLNVFSPGSVFISGFNISVWCVGLDLYAYVQIEPLTEGVIPRLWGKLGFFRTA